MIPSEVRLIEEASVEDYVYECHATDHMHSTDP